MENAVSVLRTVIISSILIVILYLIIRRKKEERDQFTNNAPLYEPEKVDDLYAYVYG